MLEKLKYLWQELNASFWLIPIALLVFFIALAVGMIYLDDTLEYSVDEGIYKYFFSAGVDSARSIMTIIAGAMIGIAGTVFSITLVALTLASSQLGSRLLRNFMYDRLNQLTLGTYVSTFVYCLIVANTITDQDDMEFVPALSILVGLLAALAGIILLIVFIHHISVSIQSDRVIADIYLSMSKHIRNLFPEQIGEEKEKPREDLPKIKARYSFSLQIRSLKTGYLQSVNSNHLIKLAKDNDMVVILLNRPGDYLVENLVICEILCNSPPGEDMEERINDNIITGKARTPYQDAEFSIHQMVEIASRALSPGINDPYTAISSIDNLTAIMCYLANAHFPSSFRYDQHGELRVIADSLTYTGMLDAAFNQIRQYGASSPAVMIRLMEALATIRKFTAKEDQQQAVILHARKVMADAQNAFADSHDMKDLEERHRKLMMYKNPG